MPRNFPPEPHAIHGHGWERVWTVADQDAASVRLTCDWPGGAWPWAYATEQTFALGDEALTVTLSVTNRSAEPMPAGLGLHPQFPRPPGTRLTFRSEGMWRADARNLPVALEAVPADWDLDGGQVLDAVRADNCFAGWDGTARIDWPDGSAVEITASPVCRHVVLYVPDGEDYLSLEPVTHANNAIHLRGQGRQDTGLVILEPGEILSMSAQIRVLAG